MKTFECRLLSHAYCAAMKPRPIVAPARCRIDHDHRRRGNPRTRPYTSAMGSTVFPRPASVSIQELPMNTTLPPGVAINAPMHPRFDEILTADALAFVAKLHRSFDARRRELLEARAER